MVMQEKLVQLRKEKGLTQIELAEAVTSFKREQPMMIALLYNFAVA